MFKIFNKLIYSNLKILLIRFTENKNYIQGMFYTNNSKMVKTFTTNLEGQSGESIKSILTDDFEIQNIDNTDDISLIKEIQVTSE